MERLSSIAKILVLFAVAVPRSRGVPVVRTRPGSRRAGDPGGWQRHEGHGLRSDRRAGTGDPGVRRPHHHAHRPGRPRAGRRIHAAAPAAATLGGGRGRGRQAGRAAQVRRVPEGSGRSLRQDDLRGRQAAFVQSPGGGGAHRRRIGGQPAGLLAQGRPRADAAHALHGPRASEPGWRRSTSPRRTWRPASAT